MMAHWKFAVFGSSYVSRLNRWGLIGNGTAQQLPGPVECFGSPGMRVGAYSESLFQAMVMVQPRILLLVLGGNDITPHSSPRVIYRNILDLVERAKAMGIRRVIFAEIIPRYQRPRGHCGSYRRIDYFERQRRTVNRLIRRTPGVAFMRLPLAFPQDYAEDGVHVAVSAFPKYAAAIRNAMLREVYKLSLDN